MNGFSCKKKSGFTLIELLVVIVLIGIILSMATLAITSGSPKERLQTEAKRFAALLQLAQDDALLNGSEFGIVLTESSYQFVITTDNGWQPVRNNNSLRKRTLPVEMELELELDFQHENIKSSVSKIGEVSKVGDVEKFEDNNENEFKPHIYLLSSGEIAPSFMLIFFIPDTDISFSVQGIEDGSVKIKYHSS